MMRGEAIEMLKNAVEMCKQPCEDCISREQAKVAIRDRFKDLPSRVEINTILNDLPSVKPQPKVRRWVMTEEMQGGIKETWYECSECGWSNALRIPRRFCPNCGCKMAENEEKMNSFLWGAIEWHYDELPESKPYKKYLVVYAPWDYNHKANTNPRLALADYYLGEAPNYMYSKEPWHFDCCYSAETREILCWADVGKVNDIVYKFLETKAESER